MMAPDDLGSGNDGRKEFLSRRDVLVRGTTGALALGALGMAGTAAGCGGQGGPGTTATVQGGTPIRGGTMTVGMMSGGAGETLNPMSILQFTDIARTYQLYNPLFRVGPDLKTVPVLAVRAEPNQDGTSWTLFLRDGVTWHDGKPLTAKDVIYTLRFWAGPAMSGGKFLVDLFDLKRIKADGPLSVTIPLTKPVADLPALLTSYNTVIVPAGATNKTLATNPNGTGPFKYTSFTAGRQSVFERNPNYWEEGRPYVDRLVINSSFGDEQARLNALIAGDIDALPGLPYRSAQQQKDGGRIHVMDAAAPNALDIYFRVDKPPFNDPRVVQALKYATDRSAMVSNILYGYGAEGNDGFGGSPKNGGIPYYARDLVREHDPERARSLLKAAGREGLTFELPISEVYPGSADAGIMFAQQAKEVGVKVITKRVPPSVYYTPAAEYMTGPTHVSSMDVLASLGAYYRYLLVSDATAPETHYGTPERDAKINAAIGEMDSARAQERWHEVQLEHFDEGGYIIWGVANYVDAVGNNVRGVKSGPQNYLNGYNFSEGWLAK